MAMNWKELKELSEGTAEVYQTKVLQDYDRLSQIRKNFLSLRANFETKQSSIGAAVQGMRVIFREGCHFT
jgi:hypothetical protein